MKSGYRYEVAELRQLQKIFKIVKRLMRNLTAHSDLCVGSFLGLPGRAEKILCFFMESFYCAFCKVSTLAKALFVFVVEVNFMALFVSHLYLYDRNQVDKKPQ